MKQVNSKNRIKRMQRVSQMLNLRLQGASLQQITDAQDPPITFQAVSKAIRTTPRDIMTQWASATARTPQARVPSDRFALASGRTIVPMNRRLAS